MQVLNTEYNFNGVPVFQILYEKKVNLKTLTCKFIASG